MIVNLTRATTHETFFQTEGANDLQFSLTMEVLPSNNLKNDSLCRGCKYQVGKSVTFITARSYNVWQQENGFKQVINQSVNGSQVP